MNINDIIVHHEIQARLTQFARFMDNRDWVGLASILSDDAIAEFGEGPLQGSAAIVGCIRRYLDACGVTQHLLGNLIVHVDGDHAESHCYVSDMHLGIGAREHMTFRTLGDYHDHWRRQDGEWRLIRRDKDNRGSVGSIEIFR